MTLREDLNARQENKWASRKFAAFVIATVLTGTLSVWGQPEYVSAVVAFLGFAAAYTTGQSYIDGKRV